MDGTSDFKLSGAGVPPYSVRGLTQTLTPIDGAKQTRRTVNGTLRDLSRAAFRKFASSVSCADQQPPALEGVWPGMTLTVDCVEPLSYKTVGGAPSRPVVPGSSYVEGDFTLYRPRLTMKILDFKIQKDEYGAVISWSAEFEEV